MIISKIFSDWRFEEPKMYELFHICWLIVTVILCVGFGILAKKKMGNDKITNRFVFSIGIFLLIIETYKQIFMTVANGSYPWYIFPFQFCSVPIYVCLIGPWIKNKKIQMYCYEFLAFFGTLAGAIVMLYPADVFTTRVTISVHTMLWHLSMIVVGVYLIIANQYGRKIKELLQGATVYLTFVTTAIILNVVGYLLYFKNNSGTWNLFYLNPFLKTHLVVFSTIQDKLGWVAYLCSYLLAFFLGSLFIWSVTKLSKYLITLFRNRGRVSN